MKSCVLFIVMFAPSFVDENPRPSDADLRMGHSLLSGVWEYTSYVDNGETLGLKLIRQRYAEDGKMTIGNRVIQVNSPDSSEASIRGYRINPVASPKQIDLTNANDRVQKGIYKFEDDELILCYQTDDLGDRPKDFTSSSGSNRVLVRLRLVRANGEDKPEHKPKVRRTSLDDPPVIEDSMAARNTGGGTGAESLDIDIKRAHQLLTGTWRLENLVDNGDEIGRRMIEKKVARDGKVTISHRVVELVNPESGQTRVLSYKIDPTVTPRAINITNAAGKVLRGIYSIEGNTLIVCLHNRDDSVRPTSFEAQSGSGDIRLKMSLCDCEPPSAPKREEEPRPGRIDLTASASPREWNVENSSLPITFASTTTRSNPTPSAQPLRLDPPRKPTEAELSRAHALLSGYWNYISVVEDGETLSADLIRRKLARDGKMIVGNRAFEVISPTTGEKRISAYRINPTTNPRQIDIISQFDTVSKGIYKFEGDELWLCIHQDEDGERPGEFEAPGGSNNRLIRLKMAAPPAAPKPAPRQPSVEEQERQREARIRSMLVGSWTFNDSKGRVNFVFQADGSFVMTRYWAKAVKRIFEGDATSSGGSWTYGNGRIQIVVNNSSDRSKLGQVAVFRLEEIGATNMIAADAMGQIRDYRKMR